MYLTHSFLAIKKGHLDHLFFYLTEDYVENQIKLKEQLTPLLTEFARNLLDKGAVVKAFEKDIAVVSKEVEQKFDQKFSIDKIVSFNQRIETPGLLVINSDFDTFNPKENEWLYISFRDYIDDYGNLRFRDLKDLLDVLTTICLGNENLFKSALEYLRKEKSVDAHKIIELKPGIFGISLDLKEAFNFIRNWKTPKG